jgi:hypothetical protein
MPCWSCCYSILSWQMKKPLCNHVTGWGGLLAGCLRHLLPMKNEANQPRFLLLQASLFRADGHTGNAVPIAITLSGLWSE